MVEPLPAKIPIWNTGGGNRTEPLTGEKTAGWSIDDQPPSSYFNWLQYYTGAWFTWLSERVTKGATDVDIIVQGLAPTASGRGGDIQILGGAADTSGRGGDISIIAGARAGGGDGGDVTISAADATTGSGGTITITAGDSAGTKAGKITITAGSGSSASPPGDLVLKAGDGSGVDAGDCYLVGGDAAGTNRNAGYMEISSGNSTGTGGGQLSIYISEDGASGSGVNSPQLYANFEGIGQSRTIYLTRHVRFDSTTAIDPARGNIRLNPKTQPTTPLTGDIYHDSGSEQVRVWDGTTYRGLNGRVYDTNADSLAVDDTISTEKTFQLTGPTDLKYVLPASYIGSGAQIRIRASFRRSGTFVDQPGFTIRFGNYAGITGSAMTAINPVSGGSSYEFFTIDLDVNVVTGGGSGVCRARSFGLARPLTSGWATAAIGSNVYNRTAIAFNGSLDIYPTVVWFSAGGGGQTMVCSSFTVDIV